MFLKHAHFLVVTNNYYDDESVGNNNARLMDSLMRGACWVSCPPLTLIMAEKRVFF